MPTRRVLLLGLAAAGLATAIVAARTRSMPERKIMRYEEGLEARFKGQAANLSLLALTHLAGFSSRLPAWLLLARQADPKRDWDGLQHLFESLLTGDVERIEAAVRATYPHNLGFVLSLDLEKIDRARCWS